MNSQHSFRCKEKKDNFGLAAATILGKIKSPPRPQQNNFTSQEKKLSHLDASIIQTTFVWGGGGGPIELLLGKKKKGGSQKLRTSGLSKKLKSKIGCC
jgi:hypothetical protein